MATFEVEFCDGRKMVKHTDTADQAKRDARVDRAQTVPHDTPRSAPEVKIKSVTRLEERAASDSRPRGAKE